MAVALAKDSIDLGIVTMNEGAMLDFYHGLLGLPLAGEVALPDGARIRRIACGQSIIRLYIPAAAVPAPAGHHWLAASGMRYCAIRVDNLREVLDDCRQGGVAIVQDLIAPRPGVLAAMISDPDGNTIELMQVAPAPEASDADRGRGG